MSSADLIPLLSVALGRFIQIYLFLIIVRVLLTWFPTIDWLSPPFSILSQLTDPYLNLFRSIIPPLGGLDLSPILAILLLQLVGSALGSAGGLV